MFSIYEIDGLQFRGPMEELEQNRRVVKSAPSKKTGFEDHLADFSKQGQVNEKAVSAYQKMIKNEAMIEPLVHIYQIMSSPVSTITPQVDIMQAWNMLNSGKINQLVVTNEKMQLAGMLSDRDILKHLIVEGSEIKLETNLTAGQVIDHETITTDSLSDIRRVARVMAHYGLEAIPVMQDEKLVGIVTRGDILRGFADNPRLNLWG